MKNCPNKRKAANYMKSWCYRTAFAVFAVLLFSFSSPQVTLATQVTGAPPAGLQAAIRAFMTLNAADSITWDTYSQVNLCPVGRVCLYNSYAYLIGYRIGDGAGSAVAYGSNTETNPNAWTYNVLYAASGPMDVPTLQSVGIDPTTAQQLLAP